MARVRRGAHAGGQARAHGGRNGARRRGSEEAQQDRAQTNAARRLIGLALVLLVIAIVVMGFGVQFAIANRLQAADGAALAALQGHGDPERLAAITRIASEQSKNDADGLTGLLNIIFGPVVTLLGSVTGFYFGRKGHSD